VGNPFIYINTKKYAKLSVDTLAQRVTENYFVIGSNLHSVHRINEHWMLGVSS